MPAEPAPCGHCDRQLQGDGHDTSRRAQEDPGIGVRLSELQPLTADFGRPEDVAGAAVYLATAPFVTGAVLTVDGGWTAR